MQHLRPKSPILSQQYKRNPPVAGTHGYSGSAAGANQVAQAKKRDAKAVDSVVHRFTSRQFTISTQSQVIADENPNRRYLLIQNKSAGAQAQIAFGTQAVGLTNGGFNSLDLPPGTSLEFTGVVPNNEVTAVCLPTTLVTVVEGFVVDGDENK